MPQKRFIMAFPSAHALCSKMIGGKSRCRNRKANLFTCIQPFMDAPQVYEDENSRSKLTLKQTGFLNDAYKQCSRPSSRELHYYAHTLGVTPERIKNWFQNRRAKERREIQERQTQSIGMVIGLSNRVFPACNDLYRRKS